MPSASRQRRRQRPLAPGAATAPLPMLGARPGHSSDKRRAGNVGRWPGAGPAPPSRCYHRGIPAKAASRAPRPCPRPPPRDRAGRPARVFTERQFRDALAQFATGVTVICARAAGGRYVGLHGELVQFGLARRRRSSCGASPRRAAASPTFEAARALRVNVLARDQVELARRFSRPHADRFAGVAVPAGRGGRAADRGLRRVVRMPAPRAIPRRATTCVFIGEVETCERSERRRTRVPSRPLRDDPAAVGAEVTVPAPSSPRCRDVSADLRLVPLEERVHPAKRRARRPPGKWLAVDRGHGEHFLGRRRQPHFVGGERLRPRAPVATRTAMPASRANSTVAS